MDNFEDTYLSPIKRHSSSKDNTVEETRKKMTKEEIDSLIDNKRSELDIKLYDLVTRNQVEEKKIEELYNKETDEEQKVSLLSTLKQEITNNENAIKALKE